MSSRQARIFSIPPGVPFLPALAQALTSGELIEGFPGTASDPLASNPLLMADATIYVPTRRAARALRSVLVEQAKDGRSAILPTIRALGDVDEDMAFLAGSGAGFLDLDPPISNMQRRLLLARLIRPWRENLPQHVQAMFGVEDVAIPASSADAIWLARDLASLMDQVETDEGRWDDLEQIVPDELADWWQVTLDFLDIITKTWPSILDERHRSNPAAHRNALIDSEINRLAANPPAGPVIIAGSTGSIPVIARLMKLVAHLPNGAVVLPGLDRDLDDASWNDLDQIHKNPSQQNPSVFGHPQYGLHKVLTMMGVTRDDVMMLGATPPAKRLRERIVSEALRPAHTTELWRDMATDPEFSEEKRMAATAMIDLVEAANEREEALAIAIALREAIIAPDKRAALVTADRNLARRVAGELERFGISADDSAGFALRDTDPLTLLRLLIECVFNPGDPVALLALIKHPQLRLGGARLDRRLAAEALELVAFRGGTGRADIQSIASFFSLRLEALLSTRRKPIWLHTIKHEIFEQAQALCSALEEAITPLLPLLNEQDVDLRDMALACTQSLENLVRDEEGSVRHFYADEPGTALAALLRELAGSEAGFRFSPAEWPQIFEALIAGENVVAHPGGHPRVFIWGALESRLQTVDTLIIGGLNEGSWPGKARNDPFMSRPMKAMLELQPPELRTGIAAHDFQMAMGMDRVILTRAQRAENAPTVPSRWLLRFETIVGSTITEAMRERGGRYLYWTREIDRAADIPFVERPNPKPPLATRPKHFSVTEIETLRRDPYAVYARRILKLAPLEPLIRDPAAAERGTLFHDILGAFTQANIDPLSIDAQEKLLSIGREHFTNENLPAEIEAVWWPRFAAMVPHFIEWERTRAHQVLHRHAEIASEKREVDHLGITLSGRADRIDVMRDATAEIIDYKTGSTPSRIQAHRLFSPQLALEAALLVRGAWTQTGALPASDLLHIRLKPRGQVEPESILVIKGKAASEKSAPELGEEAWQRLAELLHAYQSEEKGYLSRALPFRETELSGDYDHLARVLEWSAGGADDAETGE